MDINGLAQSGTALHIREKKSFDTRGKKQTYWKSPLEAIMTAMVHLDSALWPEKGSDPDDEVRVRFADSAANDITTMASAVQMLAAANSASLEQRVEMLHPEWTRKQLAEEVERIRAADAAALQAALLSKSGIGMPNKPSEGEENNQDNDQENKQDKPGKEQPKAPEGMTEEA